MRAKFFKVHERSEKIRLFDYFQTLWTAKKSEFSGWKGDAKLY